ncbi:MAG: NADP oxidoreductase [Proteobacteria bacterium]|nr:MAG: NADP oxidoreductase [Pseudomonadota bacterium]
MKIGVIGAGWLGGTVGKQWVKAGYEVMFSTRHPEELASMVKELGSKASAGTPKQAAEFGTILLFAVPGEALEQVGRDLKEQIKGKIVIDATNTSSGDNAADSAKSLNGARYVRAFSAVDATAIESSAKRASGKLGVPVASDDSKAMETVVQLVRDAGSDPVVVGNLVSAKKFQRGAPAFRANTTEAELRKILGLSNK